MLSVGILYLIGVVLGFFRSVIMIKLRPCLPSGHASAEAAPGFAEVSIVGRLQCCLPAQERCRARGPRCSLANRATLDN